MKAYQAKSNIAFREIEGETLLIHPDTNEIFVFNETGKLIWDTIQEVAELSKIKAILASHFSSAEEEVTQDIEEFLSILQDNGFIMEITK